jgi:hypothetical protein
VKLPVMRNYGSDGKALADQLIELVRKRLADIA